MVIFPLAPDQTIAQMWSNGAREGSNFHNFMPLTTKKLPERHCSKLCAKRFSASVINMNCTQTAGTGSTSSLLAPQSFLTKYDGSTSLQLLLVRHPRHLTWSDQLNVLFPMCLTLTGQFPPKQAI